MDTYHKKERKVFEKLPFEVTEKKDEIFKHFFGQKIWMVGPKKYLIQAPYETHGLDIYNFEARPDDVYLLGFFRSGTTLHCEMVWQIGNDINYEVGTKNFLDYRFPHLDFSILGTIDGLSELLEKEDTTDEAKEIIRKYQELTLKGLNERKGRRFLKCHLPISLISPHVFEVGAKVIYCARNPKDVIVSSYHLATFFKMPDCSKYFKLMFHGFLNGSLPGCPYFEHVKEAWARRHDKNFLFLFYEDTIKDKRGTIQKVADFLGKKLTKEQIDSLEDHLSIENFKNNKSVNCYQLVRVGLAEDKNKFMRKGIAGGWKEWFDEEMEELFNQWMEKNLEGTDLKFPEP